MRFYYFTIHSVIQCYEGGGGQESRTYRRCEVADRRQPTHAEERRAQGQGRQAARRGKKANDARCRGQRPTSTVCVLAVRGGDTQFWRLQPVAQMTGRAFGMSVSAHIDLNCARS